MLKRISVSRLRLGMYIHEFCGSWMDHPFWRTRFLLELQRDIDRIQDTAITEVWIDTDRGMDDLDAPFFEGFDEIHAQVDVQLAAVATREDACVAAAGFLEELERARDICATSREAVSQMFGEARLGQVVDLERINDVVGEIAGSVFRHPNAMISLARIKTADEYTYMHSVAVSALMVALAHQLGLDDDQVRLAGLGGLLHDIGKVSIPDTILNKPGRLTDEEFFIMKTHPATGAELLAAHPGIPAEVLDVCRHHHEKMDGRGYPDGLAAGGISLLARMGAICDVYDAITSNRPYKAGWDPAWAIHKMAQWTDHFDQEIFHAFVCTVGIYPIGAVVRLNSDRLAVVMEQDAASLLMPRVKVFYCAIRCEPLPEQIVDLSLPGQTERIVSRESAHEWGLVRTNELWMA